MDQGRGENWHQIMWDLDPVGDRKSVGGDLLAVIWKSHFASLEKQAPKGLGQ